MSEVKSLCGSEVRYVALEICDEQTDSDSSVIIVDEADALLRCNNLGILKVGKHDHYCAAPAAAPVAIAA